MRVAKEESERPPFCDASLSPVLTADANSNVGSLPPSTSAASRDGTSGESCCTEGDIGDLLGIKDGDAVGCWNDTSGDETGTKDGEAGPDRGSNVCDVVGPVPLCSFNGEKA
mmetsp:Transcript_12656/g.35022  ORF Transcript_12656/g.35022 Transcript_12656/m.35022 type:complete len:112 (-) Transcript_12656:1131-1466(-)